MFLTSVAITYNPFQGLKPKAFADSVESEYVAITYNPFQGLKRLLPYGEQIIFERCNNL